MRKIVKINADNEFEAWTTKFCQRQIYLGCAANQMKILSDLGYNEFIVTNISDKITKNFLEGLALAVRTTNYPIALTGNVTKADIAVLRDCGVDRIFVGAHKFQNFELVQSIVEIFGVQSLGASLIIDTEQLCIRMSNGKKLTNPISNEIRFITSQHSCSEILLHSWIGDGVENSVSEYKNLNSLMKSTQCFPYIVYGGKPSEHDRQTVRSTTAATLKCQSLIQPYNFN